MNVGASFAYISSDHEVGGTDLDSDTISFNWFGGVSKTWNQFTASTTGSAIFTEEWFDKQSLPTWTLAWSGSLSYRWHEKWRFAFNWWYNYVVDDDALTGSKPGGDSDYWMLGPRVDYQATDNVSVNLGYTYSDGPSHFNAQGLRVGVGVAF